MNKNFIHLPGIGLIFNLDNVGDVNTKKKTLKLKDRVQPYPLEDSDYDILLGAIKENLINPEA